MAESAEMEGQIPAKGPDIGAFAYLGLELRVVGVANGQEPQPVDPGYPRFQLHGLAAAGEVVGPLSRHLERGIGGWALADLAGESGKCRFDLGAAGPAVRGRDDRALGIVGRARLAPADGEAIGLSGRHSPGDGLRGLAEGDRE